MSASETAIARPASRRLARSKERMERLMFLVPAGVYLVALTIFPFVYSVYLSLHQAKLTKLHRMRFIGFDNYAELFTDSLFLDACRNIAVLTVSSITVEILIGFFAAKVFFSLRETRVGAVLRSASIVPMMITPICIGLIFSYIFNPNLGIANFLLGEIGISPLGWFSDPSLALATVILINSWQWTPFMMLLMLAGLMSIPAEQYEAAEIEGAKWYHIAAWIEIPAIRGIVLVGIILRVIDNLRLFDIVYVTTRGGPGSSTEIVTFFAYKQDFQYFQVGYGSAAAVVILFASVIITAITVKYLRSAEDD
ncbi:carbohydrate ABC transporter permease [Rhodobium gokarnense]|uniref:Multiple sugar transport system permease protein n=1 Tax=Rhodobium gokarnense TaxID=364296 RepID=A0ABT3HB03_9HYPH|nr:sugar ABC transporter permease [Rhodobium gokarnense]MCW2307565.1 multiple sugar transport system permease protein [Rhodobium gokarnense]